MGTCALFIDYENVYKSLRSQNVNVTHKQLADILKSEATRVGEVALARAYAPWDIFPEAMALFDRLDIKPEYVEGGRKDNADVAMSLAIQDYLRLPGRSVDSFVLVTGDGDFVHVIRLLQQEKKRVVVWGVEGSISSRLTSRVADIVNIQDFLLSAGLVSPPAADALRSSGDTQSRLMSDLAVQALIVRAESVMLSRGWVQVPFLTLMQEMSINTLFGEDSEQRRNLIVRLLESGILETKKQPNPKRPGTETTFILLKKDHAVVANTLQGAARVVAKMRNLLAETAGGNWVPRRLLERTLTEDPAPTLAEVSRDDSGRWTELCILEGLLRLDQAVKGEAASGSVCLVDSHPIVQQVVPGEDLQPMLKRLVLALDHYLTRTGYAWMSMGLLRQQLLSFGQQTMERAIRLANETGIIVIRQQPNQFGSRPTTGAYLVVDTPMVQPMLDERDAVLGALNRLFSVQDVLPEDEVRVGVEAAGAVPGYEVSEWISAFVTHQLLERTQTLEGVPALLLHKQHPVLVKRLQVLTQLGSER